MPSSAPNMLLLMAAGITVIWLAALNRAQTGGVARSAPRPAKNSRNEPAAANKARIRPVAP